MHEIKGEKKTNQKMEITEVKVEKFGAVQLEKRGENGRLESGEMKAEEKSHLSMACV